MREVQLTTQEHNRLLRKAGNIGLGLVFIVLIILVPVVLIRGMVWASEKALPWLVEAGQIAFAICGFVFLPLSTFKKSRPWAGIGFFIVSYVFGTELLAYSCICAFWIWGYWGLIFGLILGGVGVVPVALLATLSGAIQQRTQWDTPWEIVEMILLTFGTRYLGAYLAAKSEREMQLEQAIYARIMLTDRLEAKLRSLASRPKIADLIAAYGMNENPMADENSLYEHFLFLLRCGVCYPFGTAEALLLKGLSKPKWLRRSLELRNSGASETMIAWTLTYEGRLTRRGSPVIGGLFNWTIRKCLGF